MVFGVQMKSSEEEVVHSANHCLLLELNSLNGKYWSPRTGQKVPDIVVIQSTGKDQ